MSILNKNGYILNIDNIEKKKITKIKKDLTVSPKNVYLSEFAMFDQPKFKIYNEQDNKLCVPKYYGISNLGKPSIIENSSGLNTNMKFTKNLKDYQIPCVKKIINKCKTVGGGLVCVPCGFGKCLGKNTPILMYDGSIKMVQDIQINDIIMGDDSNPRNILSICRGQEIMYKIKQSIGDDYIVNESHILTVLIDNKLQDISLKKCFELQNSKCIHGYQVVIDFPEQPIYDLDNFVKNHSCDKIPSKFKLNSINNRKKILNKYIQFYSKNGIIEINCPILINDLLFIFRSVGQFPTKCKNGLDISQLNTNKLNTIEIIKLENDNYYGFEIDGNRRFVLGDCTVTHNTVVALNVACELKAKTLVVVHKEFLVNQWKERIQEFTNATVGTLQGKVIDVENKDIVIGMLQSISQLKYSQDILGQFKFIIYDECHHTSAEKFSRALLLINSTYQLGLSATPTRKDGLTKVFKWFLGDIIYQVKRQNTDIVKVNRYICSSTTGYYKEHFNKLGKPCIASMINNVVAYKTRNNFIVDIIHNLIKEKRNILVLSERRGHLEELQQLIKDKIDIDSGLYIGGMKNHDLELSCEKQIILATYQMASEGFDCKKLNTLLMVTSKSDIVQSIGRILRQKHENITPQIIDFCDMFSVFSNQANKRLKIYEKNNYQVTNIYVNNCKLQSKKQPKKINKIDLNKCLLDD